MGTFNAESVILITFKHVIHTSRYGYCTMKSVRIAKRLNKKTTIMKYLQSKGMLFCAFL